ncbi:response regulator transcription factor [Paenibacillus sp. P96]|uniref:Response regulator transcription factor n=1 Tax=Paenibacillus zeirhizosphaerae TaxID=2987519 RepID=A0ABT9FNK7_9BACL|nr:response regulator transcription factor [Paenibacillus sp. P96]MDP4096318.1 response regulator transcription factor [Paenibacillus sp. P96]
MQKILIIEDERAISELIRLNLNVAGYGSRQAFSGEEALAILQEYTPALILLDVMLPDQDGFAILEKIRPSGIPVIFLTAKKELADRVKGLKMGADDYIVKPFEAVELLARIEVVLRRFTHQSSLITYEDLTIELEERTVKKADEIIDLTLKEYELLLLLIRNRNKALSREKILELVWGYDYTGETRTVDIHIQKLRKKLGFEERIKTIFKFGYRLENTL